MKIERDLKITDLPYFGTIEVRRGEMITDGEIGLNHHYGLEQVREMRDALDVVIAELTPEPAKPVRLFMPGQLLDGSEDLPEGTVIEDSQGDQWGLGPNGYGCNGELPGKPVFDGKSTLHHIVKSYGPVTIVSLP